MSIYLVRHAHAGSRSAWNGDDRERPLSKKGWAQARGLAARLAPLAPVTLRSSPFERCVLTLRPLADELGLDIALDERLAETTPFEDTLAALAEAADGTVLVSHGDVIPDVVAALVRRGMLVTTTPQWRKGSLWVLERDGDRFVSAAAEPPVRG